MSRDTTVQECLACGRDTGSGTRLFAARRRGKGTVTDSVGWLCHACQEGSAAPGDGQSIPLSGRYVVIEFGNEFGNLPSW